MEQMQDDHQPEVDGGKKLRRFQFSLQTFIVAITVACVVLGLKANSVRRQRKAIEALQRLEGVVFFDSQCDNQGRIFGSVSVPPWNPLPGILDDGWFNTVVNVRMPHIELADRLRGAKNAPKDVLNHVTKLSGLKQLRLGFTDIANDDLAALAPLNRLTFVSLRNTKIHPGELEGLSGLSIERLSLATTGLDDEGLRSLAKIRTLQDLDVAGTKVSDAGLKHLKSLPNLKSLVLSRTLVTEEGYESIQRSLPTCIVVWKPVVRP